jgi:predicted PurR-regulated permease PerM
MFDRRKSKPRAEPAGSDRRQPLPLNSQARTVARTSLTIALVGLALWIGGDFLPALGWAAILAITMWPLYSAPGCRKKPRRVARSPGLR